MQTGGAPPYWEARQREEMEAFKRSLQEPKPEEIEETTPEELETARNELYRKKMPWLHEGEEESTKFAPNTGPKMS